MDMLCYIYNTTESDIDCYENYLVERLQMINQVVEEHFHSLMPVLMLRQIEKKNNKT